MAYPIDNAFQDLTPLILTQPRRQGVIESLNLFEITNETSNKIGVRREVGTTGLINARERQGQRNYITRDKFSEKALIVPFFPVDANMKAVDIQNFTALLELGTDAPLSVQAAAAKKMAKIRSYEARTKDRIFTEAVMGRSYAGIDAINADEYYDYYDIWGQTRSSIAVDFSSQDINPTDVIEDQIRGQIIDLKGDGSMETQVIAVCGRQWLQRLRSNYFTRQAFLSIPGQNPLRDRVGGNLDNASWEYNGVLYVEDSTGAIGANEAYFFPVGIENMFQAFYAPADTLDAANKPAQEFYMFMEQDHRTAHIETEFSLLAVNTRPELVIKSTVA